MDQLPSLRSSSTKALKPEHASCVWAWEGRFRASLGARLRVGGVRDHRGEAGKVGGTDMTSAVLRRTEG